MGRVGVTVLLIAALALLWTFPGASGQSARPSLVAEGARPDRSAEAREAFPNFRVHPAFAAHFTDDLYFDLDSEFGPFGSDEGYQILSTGDERIIELTPSSTVIDVLVGFVDRPSSVQTELFDPLRGHSGRPADGAVDEATIVLGAGFALFRLTGQIDLQGEQVTLEALDALEAAYGPQPEFERMRRDLLTFAK